MTTKHTTHWEAHFRGNKQDGFSILCQLKSERKFWVFGTIGGILGINQAPEPSNPTLSIVQWDELNQLIREWKDLNGFRPVIERGKKKPHSERDGIADTH